MKTEIAKKISEEMNSIVVRLDDSVRLVMENCSDAEFQGYRAAVAEVMAGVIDITNILYLKNPEVKPKDFD